MMSHGAVVAREYGIPAVVGVARATERITTGDEITVDGSAGVVSGDRLGPAAEAASDETALGVGPTTQPQPPSGARHAV
jgi:phosphoenolpyruvate synthase/pyruvate phosphate dikinase